jgi:hypothetical protein
MRFRYGQVGDGGKGVVNLTLTAVMYASLRPTPRRLKQKEAIPFFVKVRLTA